MRRSNQRSARSVVHKERTVAELVFRVSGRYSRVHLPSIVIYRAISPTRIFVSYSYFLPLAAEIFLDCVAHQARLMHRFTFRLDTEPGLTVRRVANILHFARPAIPAILGWRACKTNMRFAPVYNAARSYNRKLDCNTARLLPERRW